jgi:hypothetical protein
MRHRRQRGSQIDHGVVTPKRRRERSRVEQRKLNRRRTLTAKDRRLGFTSGQRRDVMARVHQRGDGVASDRAGASRDEHPHRSPPVEPYFI